MFNCSILRMIPGRFGQRSRRLRGQVRVSRFTPSIKLSKWKRGDSGAPFLFLSQRHTLLPSFYCAFFISCHHFLCLYPLSNQDGSHDARFTRARDDLHQDVSNLFRSLCHSEFWCCSTHQRSLVVAWPSSLEEILKPGAHQSCYVGSIQCHHI